MLQWVSLRSYPINLSQTLGLLTLVFLLGAFALTAPARAQTESTIYSFTLHESFWPVGGLVEDASGNVATTDNSDVTLAINSGPAAAIR